MMKLLIILSLLILAVLIYLGYKSSKQYDKISFKESLDLTDLPIITFLIGEGKYNFLLDTGANFSIINTSVLNELPHEKLDKVGNLYGIDGNKQEIGYVRVNLRYLNKEYIEDMQSLVMDKAFSEIKKESGVTVHGILGNAFFQKYKYVLDFNELIAYSKK